MGWRYQHDIKVKKVWKAVALTAAVLGLCSCEVDPTNGKLNDYTELEGIDSQQVSVWNKSDVFLVDYNTQLNFIYLKDIAKPASIKKREIIEQETVNNTSRFQNMNDFYSGLLNKDNQHLLDMLNKKNNARVAQGRQAIDCEVKEITVNLNDKKSFWYMGETEKQPDGTYLLKYLKKEGTCKYVSDHCVVWNIPVEKEGEKQLTDEDCKKIGKKFDYIYELETSFIGTHKYTTKIDEVFIDSQDKIELILTDILGDAGTTANTYIGYFTSSDAFLPNIDKYGNLLEEDDVENFDNPYSNKTQAIYLDSPLFLSNEKDLYSTITHEFQHMLNFYYKLQFNVQSSTWFTEMMSMLTEDAFSKYLELEYYETPQTRLIDWEMSYGYLESPFVWYSLEDIQNINKSYSATYALGAFLARNYGGLELIHEMAICEYTDMTAVEYALTKTGYSFDRVFTELNNFNVAMQDFPRILINLEANEGEDKSRINKKNQEQYITLNREWTSSTFPDLSLQAIKLEQEVSLHDMYGNPINYIKPIYLDKSKMYPTDMRLYFGGIGIWYVGNNIKKFEIEAPENPLGYYKVLYPQGLE